MTYLLVDGYNIIGQWPELARLREESLEEARKALIDIMMEFGAVSGYRIHLVFDGWQVKGSPGAKEEKTYLTIYYTPEGVTADAFIERLVAGLPKHQTVYVATSDRLEQETVLALGGLRISARDLKQMVGTGREGTHRHMTSLECSSSPLDARLSPEVRARLLDLLYGDKKPRQEAKGKKKNP